MSEVRHNSERLQVVVFTLGSESYAIDISRIQEIVLPQALTPVPNGPRHLIGLINLRSTIVPLFDLARKLGLESLPDSQDKRIIVVSGESTPVGLLVDSVATVRTLDLTSVHDLHIGGSGPVRGILTDAERFVAILDLDEALAA